ncbi:putative ATPase/class 3 adenylate cyclase [Rhizobium sp. BK181]|uniref:AAA and adenylate/guanylate cyclase domain-containing protein n=1 Tax=Rhizobium sp. BK181 TaxID=2587072 RepID=UPI00160C8BB4|nr:AAA and adenylate/guanylate cyclase domain-containing protein [Rhizobium sp. BK181]MBB3319557.1 putative ATPase/class 3 adenylate cyclase [Rhizobium sp. BK181]
MSDASLHEARLIESFAPPPLRLFGRQKDEPSDRRMALLWLDVVAFTRITGHFLARGPAGIEDLANLLELHFTGLIDVIVAHGGEPLMFAGDGLLAGWPCEGSTPSDALLRAATCGNHVLATSRTSLPSGEPIELHAVLAFGQCHTAEIGTGSLRLHVTVGKGLADLQAASITRAKGQLLVSAAACSILGDAIAVRSIGPDATILSTLRDQADLIPLTIPPMTPQDRERLAGHIPLPVASRLNSQLLDWTAELRRISVVFVALSRLDHASPDILSRLESVVAAIEPKVAEHDGFIQQIRVDERGANLVIVFGIPPVAHADDPVRAVRSAIDMRDALRGIGQPSSIGVATGTAFCGLIGNDVFRAWTTYGEAVNLAARLQGLQQGTIQCDEATVRGAQDAISFTPIGHSQVRGWDLNVPVWTPRRQDRTGFDQSMHGRDSELAWILKAFEETRQSGNSRFVLVEAESGMGKSRLLAELHHRLRSEQSATLAGVADRIEHRVPYRGWRDILTQLLGLEVRHPELQRREATLRALGPELSPRAALLNPILQLDFSETPELQAMSAPLRMEARLDLFVSLLRRFASDGSLLVTVDDAQWLDDESWTLAATAIRSVRGLCLVMAMQPMEDDARIESLSGGGVVRLKLLGLSDEEQDRLALTRLGADRIAPELANLLRARARGHPFFCLELARALHDDGLIEVVDGTCRIAQHLADDRLPLPDSIHAAVARRIDRLDLESQVTLKVASAAGLRFPTALVAAVHPTANAEPAIVGRHLLMHQRAGMLQTDHIDELDGYSFCHGIMRDVAYELMLYGQRKQLHRAIASWYEQNSVLDISRVYALIAHHLEAAGELVRAAHYLRLEAERVFGLGSVRQSLSIGLHGAALLGSQVPVDGAELQRAIGQEMEQITALLGDRRPADLVDLPRLEDEHVASLVPLLLSIAPYAYQSQKPELFALLGARCLRLTLAHGQADFTPDVYAMYSIVHAAMTGDRRTGAAWSDLSMQLQPVIKGASFARCAFINVWFHNHWVGNLEDGIARAAAGADAGLASGEIVYGCFNLTTVVVLLVAAGRPIDVVISTGIALLAQNGGRVRNSAFTLLLELQSARALAGKTRAFDQLSDATVDEEAEFSSMLQARFSNQVACYYTAKLRLAALGGDWRSALSWAEKARVLLPFFAGQPSEVMLLHYHGVAALALAAFGSPEDAQALRAEGWDCADQMRNWEGLNESWLGPKADILEGLLEAGAGHIEVADRLFRAAAQRAAKVGHLEDHAFALECLARLQKAVGKVPGSLPGALAAYRTWGAEGKRARLADEFA